MRYYENINHFLSANQVVTDSLIDDFKPLSGNTFFNTNEIAYENYKLKGLEYIKSNSLRRNIMSYYEGDLHWLRIREEWMNDFEKSYLTDVWMSFYYYEDGMTRSSFNRLKASGKDKAILRIAKGNYQKHLRCYVELNTSCVNLKELLEGEIDRMKS